ncbi:hypothetical protein B0H65DRAFT_507647 [Neurospora tetraspora]|uniref:CCHC-type domain-containing protein n=1 Tax=Neurospora tetraspora TaxID=94610 RepID=A0AAE0MSF0_9PEZI|nr:hypothetical protein B0H65DRAFT_507647 [Neurospora tetraspora]
MPYLRETHPDQLTTYSGLMTHLWRQYHDPNQEENALINFTKLKMKDNDNFDFFKNKFVRMAGECQRPKTEWKRELFQRLPAEYKKQMGAKHRDPSISFESYCVDCSVLKTIADEAKAASRSSNNKGNNKNSGAGSGGSGSAPKPAAAGGNRPTADREETTRLFNDGRCFLCKERGHTKRDCPEKERYDRERRDRVAAVVDRHLAHEGRGQPAAAAPATDAAPAANDQGN